MIQIQEKVWQWDTDVPVRVSYPCEIQFAAIGSTETMIEEPTEQDGWFVGTIPNILLQEARDIFVYTNGTDEFRTCESKRVSVIHRAKPDDYVYTETEVKDYDDLAAQIELIQGEIESIELPVASQSTLGGIKVGQNLTISEDGTLAAPYAEKGDKGDKGEPGPQGEPGKDGKDGTNGLDGQDGYTPVRGVDYWTAADVQTIQEYIDTELGVIENGAY